MSVERFQAKEDFSMELQEAAVVPFTCQEFCPPPLHDESSESLY